MELLLGHSRPILDAKRLPSSTQKRPKQKSEDRSGRHSPGLGGMSFNSRAAEKFLLPVVDTYYSSQAEAVRVPLFSEPQIKQDMHFAVAGGVVKTGMLQSYS